MAAVTRVRLPIQNRDGSVTGYVVLRLLPHALPSVPPLLLDYRNTHEPSATGPPPGTSPVQLLEGTEYHYTFEMGGAGPISTDRPEVLWPDDEYGRTGRLRTGLYTGTLPVTVFVDGDAVGEFVVEVRARKLDYLTHYEWMLNDVAESFAELIMRSFGPTQTRFRPLGPAEAPTLYQRFAFLQSMLRGPLFTGAMQHVLHNPHYAWIHEEQVRPVGRNIAAGPGIARALNRTGRHTALRGSPLEKTFEAFGIQSVPAHIPVTRTHETVDTLPNRFVKYILLRWQNAVVEIAQALAQAADSPAVRRGLRETASVLEQLDELLARPLFRRVGPLTYLPADNQVLQKRAGYRELYRLYLQFELAAVLSWSGGDDVYGAGQKDVATLYEYWVFLQLAQAVSELCGIPLALEGLLHVDDHGLNVQLRRGRQRVLRGRVNRLGRPLAVELWYNRTFHQQDAVGGGSGADSWTQTLRPDFSLKITSPGYENVADEIWLHFDAKYRLTSPRDVFSGPGSGPLADRTVSPGTRQEFDGKDSANVERPGEEAAPLAEDLLKMHAYRDAIRRSSGAYVIYPGTESALRHRYHEILPGLGAFALVPSEHDQPQGLAALRGFMDDVFTHVALQTTGYERYRYWERSIYAPVKTGMPKPSPRTGRQLRPDGAPVAGGPSPLGASFKEAAHAPQAAPFLRRPPADTVVLLGYVRSGVHYEWIRKRALYNLRADERTGQVGLGSVELAAEFILLYGPDLAKAELWAVTGDPRVLTGLRLAELGYPKPGGGLYYCLPVAPLEKDNPLKWDYDRVRRIVGQMAPHVAYGAPVAATWAQLVGLQRGL